MSCATTCGSYASANGAKPPDGFVICLPQAGIKVAPRRALNYIFIFKGKLKAALLNWLNHASKARGLIASPIILLILGFIFFEQWGVAIGFFVFAAAVVFVPLFGAGTAIFGHSLPVVLIVANAIPLGFYLLNCTGSACPNYTFAAVAPQYAGATFCGFLYSLTSSFKR